MSKLEDLIARLCPDGVEYKKIKDLCAVSIGEFVHKNFQNDNYPYPVYNGGTKETGFYSQFNRDENKIVISARGANAGFVNRVLTKFWAGNSCYTLEVKNNSINWVFLYYYLKSSEIKLLGDQQKGGIPAVSKKQVEEFKVPVPPLEVQREIVHILDSFTLLTAELAAELAARQKQYEFYRDKWLAFNETVPRVKLSDIAIEMYRGSGIKREQVTTEGIPCVRYGEIYTSYNVLFSECKSHTDLALINNPKYFEYGDVLFAITGESIEDISKSIAYMGKEKCLAGGDIVVMKHNQDPRYVAYALSTKDAIKQKGMGKVKSKVVHSSVPSLKNIEIPLPSMEVQKQLADRLDSYRLLCNDITSGLPAEIEARRKQYEYYRDKLLTFKELKKEA